MLMQIAEPGQSTVKEACKPRVVGIDLGTTNGRAAQAHALDEPHDTLASVKRLIGRGMKDIAGVRSQLPYELEGDDRAVRLKTSGRVVSPVEVSAEILKELKARAEQTLGGAIEGAVITVPAYFDD